ncbi:YraN family protein [Uliginosibacterium sp. 31-12]|uniref:YraN family protein n=1 Tax=Uliginosibacterium sp. 31-12 TaxID=3062781 RepID=UPI0026E26422|nr:YraN family protein [Uliginosibacterium sp. 31-12]MDO6387461.1 YraN family protein [Uliginosibacterium sp. 31-12]
MDALIAGFRKVLDCLLRRHALQGSGVQAERLAEAYLVARGARILARNVRCKGGEIDLIAEHAGHIAFVEVRLRRHRDFGGAAASITPTKQRRIVLAAKYWLQGTGRVYRQRPCRFDAVLLNELDAHAPEWIQAAFSMERT